jgi:hypothetical protein
MLRAGAIQNHGAVFRQMFHNIGKCVAISFAIVARNFNG